MSLLNYHNKLMRKKLMHHRAAKVLEKSNVPQTIVKQKITFQRGAAQWIPFPILNS